MTDKPYNYLKLKYIHFRDVGMPNRTPVSFLKKAFSKYEKSIRQIIAEGIHNNPKDSL